MEDDTRGWKKFDRIKLDRKQLAKRVKKAEGATQRHAHRFVIRRIDNIRLVTREITVWLLLVGAMIAGLGLQLMWGQDSYMTEGRQDGGTYVEGALGSIDTLNPLFVSTSAEASVSRLIFSSLYDYDTTGSIHQDVATGMKIDASGQVYTVTIRDDISWHDNTPLTSKDIVYTINLIKNPLVRSPLRVNWLDVSAKAIDNETVEFTLPATYAAFPYALTFPILPEHVLKTVMPGAVRESTFSRNPVGSGPFSFRRLQSADGLSAHKTVHLVASPSYYDGKPKLDRFEIHAYDTEEAIIQALKSRELSGASDISVSAFDDIPKGAYNVTPQAINSGTYLLLNTTNPILKDEKVRQALQAATDTVALRKALGGQVLPLDLPVLNSQLKGDDVPHLGPVDVMKAQALLDEAGWKMSGSYRVKDQQTLELTITTTKDKEYQLSADIVAKQWQRIGVKVNQKSVDTTTVSSTFVQDTLQGRNFDILLYELAIGADPDVYAYWHSSQTGQSGYNFANYSNKTVDATLSSARSRLEPELRNAKYKQFAKQWLADAPGIGLYQPVMVYVSNKNAQTVKEGSTLVSSADRYANVQYWTIGGGKVYKTP